MADEYYFKKEYESAMDAAKYLNIPFSQLGAPLSIQTANQLADFLNLSRSTASFRLNRLAELGALDKEAIGKKIFYKIKND